MTRDDLRAYARRAAGRTGIDPERFVRQIDQESGFNPEAHNAGSGADGIAQIVPYWHPGVNTRDPLASLDYAALLMAGYERQFGSPARALAAYNWGSGNVGGYTKSDGTIVKPWDGHRETLPAETRQYLDVILGPDWASMGGAAPSPTPAPPAPATYDPTYPAIPQNDDWNCAPTSLRWALHAFGRRPAEGWIEPAMIAAGVASEAVGLLDATGAGLAAFVVDEYGEFGYGAYSASPVLFDDIRAVAGRSPVLIGGRRWGAEGHWSGVRGYDAVRDVLLLANPADGYGGIGQTMSRQELAQRGPFSLVVLTHQGTPATPLPADPRDARISGLETALAHVCDVIVPRAAELQEEARRIRVQFLGEKP